MMFTDFKGGIFIVPLLFLSFLLFSAGAFAQSSEQRIEQLEKQIEQLNESLKTVTEELKELKEAKTEETEVNEKVSILADEIDKLKSFSIGGERTYQSKYGFAPGAAQVYQRENPGISFGGYGEIFVGAIEEDADNILDAQRVVFYTGYKFNDRLYFNSEIEFEHATTSSNLDGSDGSVSVEFAALDFLLKDEINLRGGILLTPLGIVNELHEPTTFWSVFRPSVERIIIPSTSREGGAGIFGDVDLGSVGTVSYRAYLMNSFDSRGFSASSNRGLRIKGNRARFNDVAFVGRAEYDPYPGVRIGFSTFLGNTGQNENVDNAASAFDGDGIDGFFQVYEADLQLQWRGFDLRTLIAYTALDDAELINANLGFEDDDSVGEEQLGWYVLGAYNLFSDIGFNSKYLQHLDLFAKYEWYDTQLEVPSGFSINDANERQEFTFGLNYKPIPNIVVKGEFQRLDNSAEDAVNQVNFGLGYVY